MSAHILEDDLNILEARVESDRQQVKTNEQLGREAALLLQVEKGRAKRRQIAAQNNDRGKALKMKEKPVVELLPQQGKARDAVGKKIGMSGEDG